MKLNELKLELSQLQIRIKRLLLETKYEDYCELEVEYDASNPHDLFELQEFNRIVDELDSINMKISYLSRPVVGESVLHRNSDGRFECDFQTYTCGSGIEFLDSRDADNIQWCWSSVEHDDKDYYIVGFYDIKMEGLRVRCR